MLRIRTPRSFALTSPVPISQFDQSYVNLFTYSFIKCFLSVEHYWFPQFEYMITINSFHPFEDWVSWVVAQLLSGGRQIKTPANVNASFYSFCRKGKKLIIISSKSRNNFAISRNKLQSQSIVSNCCFNFYILNQYFTCRHHICATSSLWGLFTVMFNYRIFLSSAFSTQIFCLDIFCSHLCCFDCLHSFRTVCFFWLYHRSVYKFHVYTPWCEFPLGSLYLWVLVLPMTAQGYSCLCRCKLFVGPSFISDLQFLALPSTT
jgi:hypothetical protein